MGNAVDILLAGHDHPDLAHAFRAKLLDEGLEIQHQPRVVADILPDFVHEEHQMEIRRFAAHVFRNLAREPVDADLRRFGSVEPVARRLLGNIRRPAQRFNHVVFPERKRFSRRLPRLGIDLQKRFLKRLQPALVIQKTLKGGDLQVVAIIAAVLIKHLGEHAQNRILILAHGGFRIDIEKDDLRRRFAHAAHHGIAQRIEGEFVLEIIERALAADLLVRQQIG